MDILREKILNKINPGSQKGQILLVVILATVITLTVGLSAVTRTITNTRLSTEEANSQRALSAAEAGIEELVNNQALLGSGVQKTLSNGAIFSANAVPIQGTQIVLNDSNTILKDDGADVWLSTHPDFGSPKWGGTFTVYWKNNAVNDAENCPKNAAIEIIILSGSDKNNPTVTRESYDPCASRKGNNNFKTPNLSGGIIKGVSFNNRSDPISIANGFIARIIPLYANTQIAVTGSVALPVQGYIIDSTGTSGSTSRQVRVYQGFPRLPIEFFPYNLFLPSDN